MQRRLLWFLAVVSVASLTISGCINQQVIAPCLENRHSINHKIKAKSDLIVHCDVGRMQQLSISPRSCFILAKQQPSLTNSALPHQCPHTYPQTMPKPFRSTPHHRSPTARCLCSGSLARCTAPYLCIPQDGLLARALCPCARFSIAMYCGSFIVCARMYCT
ncbi:hypothetical protein M430DRAFT_149764 [Amorphotheca resinae ATCC 22711]|jgi:hypothetical protein|uniref:Lipoprotein n=1 Tax=Amorphotheca resinae ATCC 22711 TaxID=857342 RepID=A0A2T3BCK2_AMORE|nr:hypothetical protein M430DRAFT_149764 [Amorphotheca resinae ATCC 22711]PSS27104.1 hypothetical protein M430DRAFT_149764 [Amorphotheca resinae ATCC 22711]